MKYRLILMLAVPLCGSAGAQEAELFLREDWRELPAALPITQEHVANADLILSLYGPGGQAVKKSNHPNIPNDPFYVWSGECKSNWALGVRHKKQRVDLSGAGAKIKFRSKQSGFRQLRIILRVDDGTWLVSDQSAADSEDWSDVEFRIAEVRWRKLNIESVTEGAWVQQPDLTTVREIGFTDLMSGGGTPASSRIDWMEVWGNSVGDGK